MSTIGHLRDAIIAASSHKEQSIRELETVVNHLNLFLIRSSLPLLYAWLLVSLQDLGDQYKSLPSEIILRLI